VSRYACPACAKAAMFVASLDRYVHVDGSANLPCWLATGRGEVTLPTGVPAVGSATPEPPRARRG